MSAPNHPDFAMDRALARRLGRSAPKSALVGDFDRFVGRLDGAATAAFGATALFGAVVIFAILESAHSGGAAEALAWVLTAAMATAAAALVQMWRRSRDETVQLEEETDRLRADAERLRQQMRGEAAVFAGLGSDARY